MSRFPVLSGWRVAWSRGQWVSQRPLRPALSLTCVAALSLAAAGCSQEVQRFDYGAPVDRSAQVESTGKPYSDGDYASWRNYENRDLQIRQAQLSADPVTRSLPDDGGDDSLRADADTDRSQLTPLYDSRRVPPQRDTHVVRSGDTLYSIARRYDVDVGRLARTNRLSDPGLIRVGDRLRIPAPGEPRWAEAPRSRVDDARRAPRRERREARRAPRREPRQARDRAPRYAEDQLYIDPLLRDRDSHERRPRRSAERRTRERDTRKARRAERQPVRRAERETREPRRAERQPAPRQQVARRTAPPPAPTQRPQPQPRTRTARADVPQNVPMVRREAPKRAAEKRTRSADCSDLMKNPPARSGANFRRPVNGLITSHFGQKANGERNDGINISVPRGTPVKAAENGVVVYAGNELSGLGKLVLVRHADGWVSAYAHNNELLVGRCDTVERGQQIARAGVSGNVTKPQLHFELRKNARPVDPEQHLAGTS
jgi:murein DD-endopeptidase MepM/ murein hydrolase activator NlpD